jgi:hypothetical protein
MTAYRSTDTCVSCGKAIDVKTAAYTADGMICSECEAGEMIREADRESKGGSGTNALVWGMLSLICNPFFIPSILAIVGGIRELQTIALVEPAQRSSHQVQGIIAIVLGAFWPTILIGVIGLGILAVAADEFSRGHRDPYYDDPYNEPYYPNEYEELEYDRPAYDDPIYAPVYDDPAYAPVYGDPSALPDDYVPSFDDDPPAPAP